MERKRVISMIIVIAMLITALPMTVWADAAPLTLSEYTEKVIRRVTDNLYREESLYTADLAVGNITKIFNADWETKWKPFLITPSAISFNSYDRANLTTLVLLEMEFLLNKAAQTGDNADALRGTLDHFVPMIGDIDDLMLAIEQCNANDADGYTAVNGLIVSIQEHISETFDDMIADIAGGTGTRADFYEEMRSFFTSPAHCDITSDTAIVLENYANIYCSMAAITEPVSKAAILAYANEYAAASSAVTSNYIEAFVEGSGLVDPSVFELYDEPTRMSYADTVNSKELAFGLVAAYFQELNRILSAYSYPSAFYRYTILFHKIAPSLYKMCDLIYAVSGNSAVGSTVLIYELIADCELLIKFLTAPVYDPCSGGEWHNYSEANYTQFTPEMTGYEFAGWYDKRVGGTKYADENGVLQEGKAFEEMETYYAHWKKNGVSVLTDPITVSSDGVYGAGRRVSAAFDTSNAYLLSNEELAEYGISYAKTGENSAKLTINDILALNTTVNYLGAINSNIDKLTVEVKGNNVIGELDLSYSDKYGTYIFGSGITNLKDGQDITVTGSGNLSIYAKYTGINLADSDLTFDEDFTGKLVVQNYAQYNEAIYSHGDINFMGGTFEINSQNRAINTNGKVTVDGVKTSVSAIGVEASCIKAADGFELLDGNVFISVMGGLGLDSGPVNISDGKLHIETDQNGIQTFNEDVIISGGDVEINSPTGSGIVINSFRPVTEPKVEISGGTFKTNKVQAPVISLGTASMPAIIANVAEPAGLTSGSGILSGVSQIAATGSCFEISFNEIIVRFDANGGSCDKTEAAVKADGRLTRLPVAERSGYTFDGWYTQAGTKAASEDVYTVNTTLYARWISIAPPYIPVIIPEESKPASYDKCSYGDFCPLSAFTDLDVSKWYHDAIHYCIDNDIMVGKTEKEFAPLAVISRAEVVTMLWRLAGTPHADYWMHFDDVEESKWYSEAVRWAAAEKIAVGYDGGKTFGVYDPITREQLAAMLYRYAQKQGEGFTGSWMFLLPCDDRALVSSFADEAVHWCYMKGIVNGKPGNQFDPLGNATRAEAAQMLKNFCER